MISRQSVPWKPQSMTRLPLSITSSIPKHFEKRCHAAITIFHLSATLKRKCDEIDAQTIPRAVVRNVYPLGLTPTYRALPSETQRGFAVVGRNAYYVVVNGQAVEVISMTAEFRTGVRFLGFGILVIAASLSAVASETDKSHPVIDVHLHAHPVAMFGQLIGPPPIPHCVPMTDYPVPGPGRPWRSVMGDNDPPCEAIRSPKTDAEIMKKTFEMLDRHQIVAAITSGPLVHGWKEHAPERIIASLSYSPTPDSPPLSKIREWFEAGQYQVLGEVTAQYDGIRADAPEMDAMWELAATLDIPVSIHIGTGPVGAPYMVWPNYRASLHSPFQIEEVLVRHPELRVAIAHAAWPMLDELLALMWTHPQVYVDIAVINWALPRQEFHRYLQRIVQAGFGKRVMFGSDQMVWPEAIDIAVEAVASAEFLSDAQKRDIFYNNAARFLRLSDSEIARHHGEKEEPEAPSP